MKRQSAYEMARNKYGRKIKGRPHSFSWLVTYADLMTILVCFFVLIVSFSIQDQVKLEVVAGSLRNAFGVAEERRYAGDVKLEGVPEQLQPGNIRPSPNPTASAITKTLTARPAAGSNGHDGAYEQQIREDAIFENIRERLERAIITHNLENDSQDSLTVALVPEGLQILAVDREGAPMFEKGQSIPTRRARALLAQIADVILPLANRVEIIGHADASGSGQYSAFDLTSERANAARRILQKEGLSDERIYSVSGQGAANPLYRDDPFAPGNRRIEIILERVAPILPENRSL